MELNKTQSDLISNISTDLLDYIVSLDMTYPDLKKETDIHTAIVVESLINVIILIMLNTANDNLNHHQVLKDIVNIVETRAKEIDMKLTEHKSKGIVK